MHAHSLDGHENIVVAAGGRVGERQAQRASGYAVAAAAAASGDQGRNGQCGAGQGEESNSVHVLRSFAS